MNMQSPELYPSATQPAAHEAIAIVSLSGRYPAGSNSPEQLWDLLASGRDGITEAKGARWDLGWHHDVKGRKGRVYTRNGGFLDDIRGFDADFFGISPREAAQIDPQQRLLLELTWELLENAGLQPRDVSDRAIGVYIGISNNDYAQLVGGGAPNAYSNTGSAFSIAANRISYIFNLAGPSMAVDTACSSSLVCVHQACKAILAGDCEAAIAGGVNVLADIRPWQGFAAASMLSPEGRCKSFDASGAGYVRSEGGGLVLLKPLAAAERDGDRILGVIRATGVNSDGRTKGLSMPSVEAQARLLERLYTGAGIAPEDVFYVEAHGTGTAVGDPIECEALGQVLGRPRADGSVCHIGSVKSNIGHLEPASGIAGLTKILLGFQRGEIPANLHFTSPNPAIDFDGWKLRVVDRALPLPDDGRPVVAGINSFGFGGTNSHVIVQSHKAASRLAPVLRQPAMLVISAQSEAALRVLAARYRDLLAAPGADWAEIASAAAHFRAPLTRRLVISARSAEEAVKRLDLWLADKGDAHVATGTAATPTVPVAFAFSGNGPQWWGMGRDLLAEVPAFRASIAEVDATFAPLAGWSLLEEMARPESESRIHLTEVAQPMLFALQVGVTRLLEAAGVLPAAVFGHSVGEAAAAWACGALDLATATQVIFHRSREQAATAGTGKMAALGIDADRAADLMAEVGGWLEIAAVNAPEGVTVAGDEASLSALVDRVTADGRFARLLALDYPFHTKAMDVCRPGLMAALSGMAPKASQVPFVSTVTGAELEGTALDAGYWFRNVREPVQFEQAVKHALGDLGIGLVLEIGPHPVLRDYIVQISRAHSLKAAALQTLRRPGKAGPESDTDNLAQALALAVAHGATAPEALCDRPHSRPRLPNYPWQRSEHWRGGVALPDLIPPAERQHPLLGGRLSGGLGLWAGALNTSALAYLPDHRIQASVIFPAAGYIEQALAGARLMFGPDGGIDLEALSILRPLSLDSDTDVQTQVAIDAADGRIEIRSRHPADLSETTVHFTGRAAHVAQPVAHTVDISALRARLAHPVASDALYDEARSRGLNYGPAFRGLVALHLTAPGAELREALAEVRLSAADLGGLDGYLSHPALFDSGLHGAIGLVAQGDARKISTLPISIERLHFHAPLPEHLFCHVTLRRESARTVLFDMAYYDADGRLLVDITGARCQKAMLVDQGAAPLLAEDWRLDDRHLPLTPLAALPPTAALFGGLTADLTASDAFGTAMQRLMGLYAAEAIDRLRPDTGSFDLPALTRHARIRRDQSDYLKGIVMLAEAAGALVPAARGWTWQGLAGAPRAAALWADLFQSWPDRQPELLLLAEAGDALVARLTEKQPPALNATALDQLYDTARHVAPRNAVLVRAFGRLAADWPQHRPLRVLELGAWNGALTTTLLPLLPERAAWTVTDPQEEAVARLTRRFQDDPAVTVRQIHAEDSLEDQGIARGLADIVLVSRLDRLGKDAGAVLSQAARALAQGGILILADCPAPEYARFVLGQTVTAGLADLAAAGLGDLADLGAQVRVGRMLSEGAQTAAPQPAARRFVVLSQALDPMAASLSAGLTEAGHHAASLPILAGDGLADRLRAAMLDQTAGQVVLLLPADRDGDANPAAQAALCLAAREAMLAMDALRAERPDLAPALTIVTRGAFPGAFGDAPQAAAQGAVWGLGRVMANEVPACPLRLIDLQNSSPEALVHELGQPDDEAEVQLSYGHRFVPRARVTTPGRLARASARPSEAFVLDFVPQGGFDSLHLRALTRRPPAEGEVEIAVRAAGLNFRDVLWCMGMLPEEAVEHGFSGATIGMECAGEVVRVGAGVQGLAPGDRVVAFASSCLGSHVTTQAISVAKMPEGMDFADAATLPTTFITAWYAFDYLARLEPGETVLIHGAAGGVGLAAIQIAKMKGAVVIGTAGSPLKRRVLQMLGVDHVLDSRTLDFADDVMRLTDGKGVDVILNSLAGEAILRNLNCLKPFGRFLEIGKRDFYANSRMGLRPFRNNLSYFGIDADTLLVERPDLGRRMFTQVLDHVRAGRLRPLPHQRIPVTRAAEAFRMMQQSRHIGKIVVTVDSGEGAPHGIVPETGLVAGEGTYLVTGGLAGFGLETARWLVAQGARSLALVSRSGPATPGAEAALAELAATGATVRAFAADIADKAALAAVLAQVRADMAPLAGVIHAAAVIEDAPLGNVTPAQMNRVFAPKMTGAWNLHDLTKADPIRTFILYSSASALVGNPGQGAYVAANLYLETLALHRRALGLPALAVGWGAIRDAGFLTRHENVIDLLKSRSGMEAMPVQQALSDLGRLVGAQAARVGMARFDMIKLHQMLPAARSPRFAPMIPQDLLAAMSGDESFVDQVRALPRAQRMPFIQDRLRESVARILGTTAAQINLEQPISDLGLDSLMAVELAGAIERDIGSNVPVMQLLGAGSLIQVAAMVGKLIGLNEGDA